MIRKSIPGALLFGLAAISYAQTPAGDAPKSEATTPPVEVPAAKVSETDEAIARFCANYIGDGSVIQTGVGAVPDAILRLLHDRKDLGVHSGMLGDGLVDLIEAGVVTNARKEIDRGVTINGALIGTSRLYRFAHDNPAIRMTPTSYTHDAAVLGKLSRLVTLNSALEVDLTGQVNAEQSGSAYLGGTGGQVDFVRAGARSPGGASLMVLGSTAKGGAISKIVPQLSGPVTTARSEVDVVVTEGFTGNITLKTAEGTAKQISAYLKQAMGGSLLAKIGYLLARGAFQQLRGRMDTRSINGGVFLGLEGIVIKSHGGADAVGFARAVEIGYEMARADLLNRIRGTVELAHLNDAPATPPQEAAQ